MYLSAIKLALANIFYDESLALLLQHGSPKHSFGNVTTV